MSLGPALQPEGGYRFGPFLFDPLRRLLWKDRRVVPTTSKSLDILQLLIEHRNRVVTKDEFLLEIWGETVVEEGTLVRHLSSLRKAMGLAHGQHDYIVTVPGHGYRFVAKVTELAEMPADLPTVAGALASSEAAVEPTVAAPAASIEPLAPSPDRTWTKRRFLYLRAAALAVGMFALGALGLWGIGTV